jgi:hypothetical protein
MANAPMLSTSAPMNRMIGRLIFFFFFIGFS